MTPSVSRFACVAVAALLAACSGASNVPTFVSGVIGASPNSNAASAVVARSSPTISGIQPTATQNLTMYALNQGDGGDANISVYSDSGAKVLRKIPLGGTAPNLFAVSAKGFLFAPMDTVSKEQHTLNVYANQGRKLVETLYSKHSFYNPVVDGSGNLFILCAASRICEYKADRKTGVQPNVTRKIQFKVHPSSVGQIAADPVSGDLAVYVHADSAVEVIPPRQKSPTWTIPGIYVAGDLAFDSQGNLYVVVLHGSTSAVEEFSPGATSPSRTISQSSGVYANVISLDQAGNLYVLTGDCLRSCTDIVPAVYVYPPSGTDPSTVITKGLVNGTSHDMSVSSAGQLFVTNEDSPGSIVVYASGTDKPRLTVRNGLSVPAQVRVSP
jgi:hypothetical protein